MSGGACRTTAPNGGVLGKAEILARGTNTRTRTSDPTTVYDWCVDRGKSENWIKGHKRDCFAELLARHRFWASYIRLLLRAAAN